MRRESISRIFLDEHKTHWKVKHINRGRWVITKLLELPNKKCNFRMCNLFRAFPRAGLHWGGMAATNRNGQIWQWRPSPDNLILAVSGPRSFWHVFVYCSNQKHFQLDTPISSRQDARTPSLFFWSPQGGPTPISCPWGDFVHTARTAWHIKGASSKKIIWLQRLQYKIRVFIIDIWWK